MAQTASVKKRIEALREKLGMTQDQLADALGLSRSAISALEVGRLSASAEVLIRLAGLATKPKHAYLDEARFFLAQARLDPEAVFSVAAALLPKGGRAAEPVLLAAYEILGGRLKPEEGDMVAVPRCRFTDQGGREAAGIMPARFEREFIPNPRSTICVTAGDRPRGEILLDTSYEGADLSELWEKVVMLHYAPPPYGASIPAGIYFGRLRLETRAARQPQGGVRLVGYLDELAGDPFHSVIIGEYIEEDVLNDIAPGNQEAFARRHSEVVARGRAGFRLREGVKILGKVIGRLTGHLESRKGG